MKTLKLTLNKAAFDVTGTKEKMYELRRKSKWIESRLFDKDGMSRRYDFIELRNGYSKTSPVKTFKFCNMFALPEAHTWNYSNGLEFKTGEGDYVIIFEKIKNSKKKNKK